jgi:hypothetical protein
LDEHRAKFKANLWNRPTATEVTLGVEGQKPMVSDSHKLSESARKERQHLRAMEKKYSGTSERPTDIEEVRIYICVIYLSTKYLHRYGFLGVIVVRIFSFMIEHMLTCYDR